MQSVTESMINKLQSRLRDESSGVPLEFATLSFPNHIEVWVYVLDMNGYDAVRARCDQISDEMALEQNEPEIWLLPKRWTGPWPGSESEQYLNERRDAFRRKHNLHI